MSFKQVLHIGANKSASTTLQRCLFPNAKGLVYLGEDCENYSAYRDDLNSMIYEDDFNFSIDKNKKLFEKFQNKASETNSTFLYSNEDIMTSRVPSQVLARMKILMPDAKVLLIIRNQLQAIPSWYANHGAFLKGVPRFYWRKYVSADEFMNYFTTFFNYGPFDCFMYFKIINHYANVFGKENIKILFFEDFVQDRNKFVKELSELLNINYDESLKLLEGKVERQRITQRRFLFHKASRKISFLHSLKLPVALDRFIDSGEKAKNLGIEKWESKIADIYREDNRLLMENYKLDLKKYNYPL